MLQIPEAESPNLIFLGSQSTSMSEELVRKHTDVLTLVLSWFGGISANSRRNLTKINAKF